MHSIRRYIIFLFVLLTVVLPIGAETVPCRPGQLHALVSAPGAMTELVLAGTADASDFFFIGSKMPSLRRLDISGLTIAAYRGDKLGIASEWPAATIPSGALAGSAIESVILPTAPTAIGETAFTSTALKSIVIPASITSVGENAFADCRNLTTAAISVSRLGGYTFRGCTALKDVTFTGSVALVRCDFAGCTALDVVNGSENITIIGKSSFEGCVALKSFDFGKKLETLGERAFAGSRLESAIIPSTAPLAAIGPWAFADCKSLAEVSLPESVATVGRGAFFGVSRIASMTLPGGVEALDDYAMVDMKELQTIDASALRAVPALGDDVFEGIDQPATTLKTDPQMADEFLNAAQWQEFKIDGMSMLVDLTGMRGVPVVRGRINGGILEIEAQGTTLSLVEVYDTAGQFLTALRPGSDTVCANLSGISSPVLIVRCTTAEEMRVSLKLVR